MTNQLDALKAQVAANKDATESAITLIKGLAVKIEACKTDPVAIQALVDDLKGQQDNLAAAVVANTPSEP